MARNPDFVRYVIVSDVDGLVTHASSPRPGRPPVRSAARGRTPSACHPRWESVRIASGERLLEVRSALDGTDALLGSLAVGFSLDPIERQVAAVARYAALVALVLMLFNSALTALYVETLIRPILNLNETMKRAGRGDLSVRRRRSPRRRGRRAVGRLQPDDGRARGGARPGEGAAGAARPHREDGGGRDPGRRRRPRGQQPAGRGPACLENMRAHPEDDEMQRRGTSS